jgi:hypothetical protein
MAPEPQSQVPQEKRPLESYPQPVRAHRRPDHAEGASTARDSPGASAKPVVSSVGVPALDSSPGHTVYAQELVSVNVVDNAAGKSELRKRRKVRRERAAIAAATSKDVDRSGR